VSSPSDRAAAARLLGKIGAEEKWGRCLDRTAATAAARTAFEQGFLDRADGDPVRAAHLRKAHFARLALKSAQARRAKRAPTSDTAA